ncbi:RNA 2',3'-cyclic phosphodiesterase [Pseudoalteromonas xiamenensis]|uniref:RNA 2',3'-cyclic phosphodiesterase n=1 Tax=Pseudoalteromonas xiamenensis TaxID=882626 RepID=UPI0035ECBF3F
MLETGNRRLFFGIGLKNQAIEQISAWLMHSVHTSRPFTAPYNLHLTLAFYGMVKDDDAQALIENAAKLNVAPFSLTFEETAYWQHSGIFYLKPNSPPTALSALAEPLRDVGEKLNIYTNPHPFSPHITLCRGVKKQPEVVNPIEPLIVPVDRFHLYHSHRNEKGLIYEPIKTFLLN